MSFATKQMLDAALPHILEAPKEASVVENLCFRPAFNEREFPQSITLTPDEGIVGDRWTKFPWMTLENGDPDPAIQVSILNIRVWQAVKTQPDFIHPGDTFMADFDTSEANCPKGTRLSVGTAILNVSGVFNEGCVKWQARYGKDAREWLSAPEHRKYRLRGLLCSIEQGGTISNGDVVRKL